MSDPIYEIPFALVFEGGGLYGSNSIAGCPLSNDDSIYYNSSIYPNPSSDGYDVKWCFDPSQRCTFQECASNACLCGAQSGINNEYERYPTILTKKVEFNIQTPNEYLQNGLNFHYGWHIIMNAL